MSAMLSCLEFFADAVIEANHTLFSLRLLEEGKLSEADKKKDEVEEKQRERRKEMAKKGEEHVPRFFVWVTMSYFIKSLWAPIWHWQKNANRVSQSLIAKGWVNSVLFGKVSIDTHLCDVFLEHRTALVYVLHPWHHGVILNISIDNQN